MPLIFCLLCHFRADYKHYQVTQKFIYGQMRVIRYFIGNYADENKICLPCQVMALSCRGIETNNGVFDEKLHNKRSRDIKIWKK